MQKFVFGTDGYIFLDNDTNGVQDQTAGRSVLLESNAGAIYQAHKACAERSAAQNRRYIHIVAPNKETAYREHLPGGNVYQTHGLTPLHQYRILFPESENITYFDDDILRPGIGLTSYDKGESHWTPQGALLYLKFALAHFQRMEDVRRLNTIRAELIELMEQGDLAGHAAMPPERVSHIRVKEPRHTIEFEGDIINEGYIRHCRSPIGVGKALVLHDSFCHALFPFISEIYGETLFMHCPNFLIDIENSFEPDIIIKLQVERFFPYAPQTLNDFKQWGDDLRERKGTSDRTSQYISGIIARRP